MGVIAVEDAAIDIGLIGEGVVLAGRVYSVPCGWGRETGRRGLDRSAEYACKIEQSVQSVSNEASVNRAVLPSPA